MADMNRNFSECPHCALLGHPRVLRPSTPRTPPIVRSNGKTYHLFLEEFNVLSPDGGRTKEIAGLFRYDLDPVGIKAESTLVRIPQAASGKESRESLEDAADRLASILEDGRMLCRVYQIQPGRGLVEASRHFPGTDLSRT